MPVTPQVVCQYDWVWKKSGGVPAATVVFSLSPLPSTIASIVRPECWSTNAFWISPPIVAVGSNTALGHQMLSLPDKGLVAAVDVRGAAPPPPPHAASATPPIPAPAVPM